MKTLLAWSSGKDSAWALHLLRRDRAHDVVGLLTTVNDAVARVSMHGVREDLLDRQAAVLGLPVLKIRIPSPCSDDRYDAEMRAAMERARADGVEAVAFGDLFLEDVRRYREERLAHTGLTALFPLWGAPTDALAREMIDAAVGAVVTCIDPKRLDPSFAGRSFDSTFVGDLPAGVDPCGENGEFHTFAFAGPMFPSPLAVEPGTIVERDGFVFADLRPAGTPPDAIPAWIPAETRARTSLADLETRDESAFRERDRLERLLGQHVAAYRKSAAGTPGGLCSVFACAALSADARACLEAAEAKLPHVLFVAYARPLRAVRDRE